MGYTEAHDPAVICLAVDLGLLVVFSCVAHKREQTQLPFLSSARATARVEQHRAWEVLRDSTPPLGLGVLAALPGACRRGTMEGAAL